ncbi:MAG: hypothetical protein IPI81_17435 [Flavobacteriales bacterium]|nr:hypothetical protein [Flavobacteriales bacterium]
MVLDKVMPLINDEDIPVKDRLRTVVEHIVTGWATASRKRGKRRCW